MLLIHLSLSRQTCKIYFGLDLVKLQLSDSLRAEPVGYDKRRMDKPRSLNRYGGL